eukprot:jgi/Mesen1/4427/ME000225S03409
MGRVSRQLLVAALASLALLLSCHLATAARDFPQAEGSGSNNGEQIEAEHRRLIFDGPYGAGNSTVDDPVAVQLEEKRILLKLKAALGNHPAFEYGNWVEVALHQTANTTLPCLNSWLFAYCDTSVNPPRVQALHFPIGDLASMGTWPAFTGELPWDELTKLTYLKEINFQGHSLSGPALPENIDAWPRLSTVNMQGNNFNGSIPAAITRLKNLKSIDLSINQMTGPLPAGMDNMTALASIALYQNKLSGTIPPEIGNMSWVTKLDIGFNQFNGSLPSSFSNFTKLKFADVSNNQFYGAIPASLVAGAAKFKTLRLANNYFNGTISAANALTTVSGNCLNGASEQRTAAACTTFYSRFYPSPPPAYVAAPADSKKSSSSIPIAAVVVPCLIALLVALIVLVVIWRRRKSKENNLAVFKKGLKQNVTAFGLSDLKRATKKFNQIIGKGGYGTVYKATLKDGTIVAVKRLDQVSKQGDVEFIREVELLSRLHHRHLVNLVGFCAEGGERILVYEYMSMGSLYEHLHGPSAKEFPLSWDSRTKIAIHVALGLEYLHYGADPPLIHRDVKSANILLSGDGYSKVADFGLCKEAPLGADGTEAMAPTATAVRGSFGYLDPEYVNTSILSEKSDVYSYGVVLLELISGHKSIHEWQPLAYWAEEYLADREKTPLMVDPALQGNFDIDELYALCDIARTCVQVLVDNLGHTLSSYAGSTTGDSASIGSTAHSETSSVTGSSFTMGEGQPSLSEFSYQNYSETLHWSPNDSGQMSGSGPIEMAGAGRKYQVPMPARPKGMGAPPSNPPSGTTATSSTATEASKESAKK